MLIEKTTKIALQTRKGNDIDNEQVYTVYTPGQLKEIEDNSKKYLTDEKRAEANPLYNCHGLTFATRRTGIFKTEEVKKILTDDEYKEITLPNILAGDIVLYIEENGDITHSGIVIDVNDNFGIRTPRIISKWGTMPEFIHLIHECPYPNTTKKYYRNG